MRAQEEKEGVAEEVIPGFQIQEWEDGLGALWRRLGLILTNLVTHAAPRLTTGQPLAYSDLPEAPVEPQRDASPDSLDPSAQDAFAALDTDLDAALAAGGYTETTQETRRTDERQAWLWGIGRLFRAPGRTGIVTNAMTAAQSSHGSGFAKDYSYTATDGAAQGDLTAILRSVAKAHPEMVWGGNWKGLHDPAHWEKKR